MLPAPVYILQTLFVIYADTKLKIEKNQIGDNNPENIPQSK